MNRKSKKTGASEELWSYHLDKAYDLPWLFILWLIPIHDCGAASKGSTMQDDRKCSFCRPGLSVELDFRKCFHLKPPLWVQWRRQ